MLFVFYLKNLYLTQVIKIFSGYSSGSLTVSTLLFKSMIHFRLIFVYGVKSQGSLSEYGYLIVPVLLVGKTIPSHSVTLSKIFWAYMYGSISVLLCSTDLYVYLYANTTVLRLLQFYSLEIRKCKTSNIVLFQNCFGSYRSFAYPYKLYSHLVKSLPQKKAIWIFTATAWCLQVNSPYASKTPLDFQFMSMVYLLIYSELL